MMNGEWNLMMRTSSSSTTSLRMTWWLVGCLVIDGGGGLMFQLNFGFGISEFRKFKIRNLMMMNDDVEMNVNDKKNRTFYSPD